MAAMSMKSIYVKDTDAEAWDAVADVARRRKQSLSALLSEILADWMRQRTASEEMGLPAGFQAPTDFRDPEVVRREELATDIRDAVLKILKDREPVSV